MLTTHFLANTGPQQTEYISLKVFMDEDQLSDDSISLMNKKRTTRKNKPTACALYAKEMKKPKIIFTNAPNYAPTTLG